MFDLDRAIKANDWYQTACGWLAHIDLVSEEINQSFTDKAAFARAVLDWQRGQGRPFSARDQDGILGPKTWAVMRRALFGRGGSGRGGFHTFEPKGSLEFRYLFYNFDVNSAQLKSTHKRRIEDYVVPKCLGGRFAVLVGMASATGGNIPSNTDLSTARADAVARVLRQKNVNRLSFRVEGHGAAPQLGAKRNRSENAFFRSVFVAIPLKGFAPPSPHHVAASLVAHQKYEAEFRRIISGIDTTHWSTLTEAARDMAWLPVQQRLHEFGRRFTDLTSDALTLTFQDQDNLVPFDRSARLPEYRRLGYVGATRIWLSLSGGQRRAMRASERDALGMRYIFQEMHRQLFFRFSYVTLRDYETYRPRWFSLRDAARLRFLSRLQTDQGIAFPVP